MTAAPARYQRFLRSEGDVDRRWMDDFPTGKEKLSWKDCSPTKRDYDDIVSEEGKEEWRR